MNQNAASNPYSAPMAEVSDQPEHEGIDERFTLNIFSREGRVGRVRYLNYGAGFAFLFYVVILVAMLLGRALSSTAVMLLVGIVGYVFLLYCQVMLNIKRCHDFDKSGWFSLLMLVPLVNLAFIFWPGTQGGNRFGKQTARNSTLSVIVVCILPVIAVIGILAAIALPAYQSYVQRAHAAQLGAPR